MKTTSDAQTEPAEPRSVQRMVMPPSGLKLLDDLAWRIGRDDAAQGLPPVRCQQYRADKWRMYMDGYEAQKRHNAPDQRPGRKPKA